MKLRLHEVRRNDLVYVSDGHKASWDRVVDVGHESAHPVVLRLADGTKVVGDAMTIVDVRRLRVL